MVSGFTDWDVPVNINAQTLGEIINRPKYGGAIDGAWSLSISAGETKSIQIVSARGVIYGGIIKASASGDLSNDLITMIVDGTLTTTHSFASLLANDFKYKDSYFFWLTKYDPVNFIYSVVLSNRITFESSVLITYENTNAFSVDIISSLIYATI